MSHRLYAKLALSAPLFLCLILGAGNLRPVQAQTTTTTPASQAKAKAKEKTAEPAPKTEAAKKLIDLNKATAEEMVEVLPGVGPVTAKKIVEGRPYAKVDDLAKAGIPARTLEGIRTLVTVGTSAAPVAAKSEATKKMAPPATKEAAAKTKVAASAPATTGAKVNLNTASTDELETLPGIGPAYAKKIIELRPIKKLTDLEQIKGLSTEKIEELDEHVIILAAAPPKTETTPAPAPAPTTTTPAPIAKAKSAPATKTAAPATKTAAPATSKSESTHLTPGQKINLNKASQDDLQLLPGIGPVKSQAIIDARPFKTIEDVMKVKGIKEGSFAKIKDHIVVD